MEYCDLYDENRNFLNKTILRGEPLPKGCFVVAVSVWTVNSNGELLLTLRAPEKESWPNYWENTGGASLAGESSFAAAVRELREETGISVQENELCFLGTERWQNGFMDVYGCRKDIPIENIVLQPTETAAAQWASFEQTEKMCQSGEIAAPIAERFFALKPILLQFVNESTQKKEVKP